MTQLIELKQLILKNKISFFSIMLFVTLGITIFFGFSWASTGLVMSVDNYIEAQKLYDFEIVFPSGFDDELTEKLLSSDAVGELQGTYLSYQKLSFDGNNYQAYITSAADRLNIPDILEGRLPSGADEVVVDHIFADKHGVVLGDRLELTGEGGMDFLEQKSFSVCGIAVFPANICTDETMNGVSVTDGMPINVLMYVDESAFRTDLNDGCPSMLIRSDSLRGHLYSSDEYSGERERLKETLTDIMNDYVGEDKAALLAKNEEKISSSQQELDDAKQELDDAKQELEDSEAQLDKARETLDMYESVYGTRPKEKEDELADKQKELDDARESYSDKLMEYEDGVQDLQDYSDMLQSYADFGFLVKTRDHVNTLRSVTTVGDIANNLRYSLASLFIIVGVLICYSVMLRMIYMHLVQIGTKKALGFGDGQIAMLYLVYTALATVLGCVAGIICSKYVLEKFFITSMLKTYRIGEIMLYSDVPSAVTMSLAVLLIMLAVTWFSIRTNLRKNAITLLAGAVSIGSTSHFYDNFPVYQRLSLFTKTIVNNFVTDKKRIISTVIGITGCTALIVSSVALRDNVLKSFDNQFERYFRFNTIVKYDSSVPSSRDDIASILDEEGITRACVYFNKGMIDMPDNNSMYADIVVPENYGEFSKLVEMDVWSADDAAETDKGLWISRAYRNYFGQEQSETLDISTFDGKDAIIPISGSFNCHNVKTWVIMSPDCFREYFDCEPEYNSFFTDIGSAQSAELLRRLNSVDGYILAEDFRTNSMFSFGIFKTLTITIVIIFTVMSVAMSILVLMNLLTQFVSEKKNELIVLMINGYSSRDAKKYIYYDTILLTFIGILLGLALGTAVGYSSVKSFDSQMVFFLREFSLQACICGALGSALLTYIMSKIALSRIDRFKLTDLKE